MNNKKPAISLRKVRQFVQIVLDETENPSSLFEKDKPAEVTWCLIKFQGISDKYDERFALKILSIATNKTKPYLAIDPKSTNSPKQKLIITSDGLLLLTRFGFLNELIQNSFINILPVLSIIISFVALLVSIFQQK